MVALIPLGQKAEFVNGQFYVFSEFEGSTISNSDTFEIDQSAKSVVVIAKSGGSVGTVTLEASGDSNTFLKTVTFAASWSGVTGRVVVITNHGAQGVGSVKPAIGSDDANFPFSS